MRPLRQTFLLIPATNVEIDQSVIQPTTNYTYEIHQQIYTYKHSSQRYLLPPCFHCFGDHHRGSFTTVQQYDNLPHRISITIQCYNKSLKHSVFQPTHFSYYTFIAPLMMMTKVIDTFW
jgi:hypothetical protein